MEGRPWTETKASVVQCKPFWEMPTVFDDVPFIPSITAQRYIVTFSYEANGRGYLGKYLTFTKLANGHTFAISYDPDKPGKNSGTSGTLTRYSEKLLLPVIVLAILYALVRTFVFHR